MVAIHHGQLIAAREMSLDPLAFEPRDPAGHADALAVLAGQLLVAEQLGWPHAGQFVHQAIVGV